MDSSIRRVLEDAGLDPELAPKAPRRAAGWRSKMKALVGQLIEALRAQPGINVRLPSAHQPPFRSQPLAYYGDGALTIDPAAGDREVVYMPVTWSGPAVPDNVTVEAALSVSSTPPDSEAFPEGHIGHVLVRVWAYSRTMNAAAPLFDPLTMFRWTLFKNGVALAGYTDRFPSCTVLGLTENQLIVGPPPTQQHFGSGADLDFAPRVPLLLLPSDRLVIRCDRLPGTASGTGPRVIGSVEGWAYPSRRTSDDVRTTLTD